MSWNGLLLESILPMIQTLRGSKKIEKKHWPSRIPDFQSFYLYGNLFPVMVWFRLRRGHAFLTTAGVTWLFFF